MLGILRLKLCGDFLGEAGKTCIVVNVPVTYPPEKIKGCIVTGMLTPPNACYAYPADVYKKLKKMGYSPHREGVKNTLRQRNCLIIL